MIRLPRESSQRRAEIHAVREKTESSWVLVRTKMGWLLIKHRDEYASEQDVVADEPRSAVSKKLLAQIARETAAMSRKLPKGIHKSECARI